MNVADARRGVRVRCVNGTFHSRRTDPFNIKDISLPREGVIYTIREVVEATDEPGIRLLEVQSPQFTHDIGGVEEPCFSLDRFEVVTEEDH